MTDHTRHRNVPSHLFHELFANREAQSGAPELPRGGAIGLRKRVEETRLRLGGNADACICHGRFNRHHGGRLFTPRDVDHHLALLAKLERIPDQIDENLTQSAGVTPERRRYRRVEETPQLHTLLLRGVGEEI